MRTSRIYRALLAMLLATVAGCNANAIKENQTTFLTQDDLIKMTDQMAQEILKDPYLTQQAQKGPLTIVIKPVINETMEVINDSRKALFVSRLRGILASQPALRGKFVWVVNKDDYDRMRREEIPESQIGPSESRIVPEYALYAKFFTDTNVTLKTRSDTYLCSYYLTRISGNNTGEQLWNGQYETSKRIKKDFLD